MGRDGSDDSGGQKRGTLVVVDGPHALLEAGALPWEQPGYIDPATAYLGTLAKGSVATQRSALRTVAWMLGAPRTAKAPWMFVAWHKLTPDIAGRIASKLREDFSTRTVNRMLAAVLGTLTACRRNDWLSRHRFDNVAEMLRGRKARSKVRPGTRLTDTDLARLLAAADLREAAILSLGAGAGLRREEMADLAFEHVDFTTGVVQVNLGKGDKDRITVLPPKALARVAEWAARSRAVGNVTLLGLNRWHVWKAMQRLGKRLGLVFATHDLRRAWVTRQLAGGTEARFVQAGAGHEKLETTMGYDMRGEAEVLAALRKVDLP